MIKPRKTSRKALIPVFITIFFAAVLVPMMSKKGPRKIVKSVAYVGRYTNAKDSISRDKQTPAKFDVLHQTVLEQYLRELSDSLTGYKLELKVFDMEQVPEKSDSIYRLIRQDTSILAVIDNTWGVDLKACANTIKSSDIPVVAMNGDKNGLDFGNNVLFTGNGDNIPYDLAAFIQKAMERKTVNLITETDYPLHQSYLDAFDRHGITVNQVFTLSGKKPPEGEDSARLMMDIANYYQAHPSERSTLLVLNVHNKWGKKILSDLDRDYDSLSILGHAYVTSVATSATFGKSNGNRLTLITNPVDALSKKITLDLEHFKKQQPEIFDHVSAPLFLKRCQDAVDLIRLSLPDSTIATRGDILSSFHSMSNRMVASETELYTFDSALQLVPDLYFTTFSDGNVNSSSKQLNERREIVPNLFFGMEIIDIYDINVSENSFSSDFYYWVKVDTTHEEAEKFILFQNMKQSESAKELVISRTDEGVLYRLYKVSGKFFVNYELRDYPRDRQELAIQVEIMNPLDKIKIAFDQSAMKQDKSAIEKFKVTAWDKEKYFVTVDNRITGNLRGDPTGDMNKLHKFQQFSFHLLVARKTLGPFLEIILPLFLIGMVAIALLFIRDISFENLGEAAVGTFLGIITFSIALSNITPSSDALTKADLLFWITFSVVLISFMTIIVLNALYDTHDLDIKKIRRVATLLAVSYPLAMVGVLLL